MSIYNDVDCSRSYYDAVIEHCEDFIVAVDLDLKVMMMNSIAENALCISRLQAVGQNLFEICNNNGINLSFTEEDLKFFENLKNKFINGYIIDSHKQKVSMLWKQILVNDQQKNKKYFLILGKDISILEKLNKDSLRTVECLVSILDNIPGYLYWKDLNFSYCGCNKNVADYLGLIASKDVVGKNDKDFGWSEERVQTLCEEDTKIVTSRIPNIAAEIIPRCDGAERVMLSTKTPLIDVNNNVIGIVGISVDVTAEKEAERLRLENELQQAKLHEQESVAKVSAQVSHDIRSPISSLEMILAACNEIPESKRVSLITAMIRVKDIANNLLFEQRKYDESKDLVPKPIQPMLISLAVEEALSLKRAQYSKSPIIFNSHIDSKGSFTFIRTDSSNFGRMLSNIINNAVDAFEDKEGIIDIDLAVENQQAIITIQDNGKGMPQEVINKLMGNTAVTSGKKGGNGIGMAQARSALHASNGKMQIESEIGIGTKFTLIFPICSAPDWIAEKIVLHKGDTVVIIDDDHSIHDAWNIRFENYSDIINVKHFEDGEKVIEFINNFPEKSKIFLLADFELIGQKLTGIDIIKQVAISQRPILVTSHYDRQDVRDLAANVGVKILPKQLAIDVSVEIKEIE